jgi:hypothetical protein
LFNYLKLSSHMSKQDIYWNLEDYKHIVCMYQNFETIIF